MLTPGKYYPKSPIRLTATFTDDDGTLINPDTVKLRLMSPSGNETTLTYGTDSEMGSSATGKFYADVTPDQGGRWFYRWETTGAGKTLATEGDIIVQLSPFVDQMSPPAYSGRC